MLLQNRGGLLPLQADQARRVAVIGPHAAEVMLGGYSGVPRHSVSILEGVRKRLGADAIVRHAEGVRITEDSAFTRGPQPLVGGTRSQARWSADRVVLADPEANRRRIAEAVALARDSDVVIVVVGDNEQTSREAYAENHLGDRSGAAAGGTAGGPGACGARRREADGAGAGQRPPPAIPELAERAPAILECWYLGQEGGTAVAEVLFGDVNPGGKLPVSFPRSVGQLPLFYNRKPTAMRGYLFASTRPLFPFGHGLSYTTFAYSAPTVSPARIPPDGRATVSVEVTNTGERAGDEVVQLYIRDEVSRATRPVMELKGFRRITLAPGERRTVTLRGGAGAALLSRARPEARRRARPLPVDGRRKLGRGEVRRAGRGGAVGRSVGAALRGAADAGNDAPRASPGLPRHLGDSLQVRAEDHVLPRRDGHLFELVSQADLAGVPKLGMEHGASQLAVLPGEVHHVAAACAEPLDGAVRPGAGQGGKELDAAVVALEEHLGDAGGRAEVAVDLERRVGVEEVRQGVARPGPRPASCGRGRRRAGGPRG